MYITGRLIFSREISYHIPYTIFVCYWRFVIEKGAAFAKRKDTFSCTGESGYCHFTDFINFYVTETLHFIIRH